MNVPDLILTPAEVQSLTGYAQPVRQAAWLKDRGWIFEPPRRRGESPKVSRAYFEARMAGKAPEAHAQRQAPRFAWMTQGAA